MTEPKFKFEIGQRVRTAYYVDGPLTIRSQMFHRWRNSDGEIKEEKLYGFEHMPATYCGPSQLSERALIENLNPIAPKGEVQAPVRATCKLCLLPSVSCWNIDGGYICLSCFDYESETESDLEAAPEAVEEN